MINTRYIGMRFGGFEVIGYSINFKKSSLIFGLKCSSCKSIKDISIKYEKVLRVKCKGCGRLDIVVPIEYYAGYDIVKDTISIGEYKYNKLRKEFLSSGSTDAEIDFIRNKISSKK